MFINLNINIHPLTTPHTPHTHIQRGRERKRERERERGGGERERERTLHSVKIYPLFIVSITNIILIYQYSEKITKRYTLYNSDIIESVFAMQSKWYAFILSELYRFTRVLIWTIHCPMIDCYVTTIVTVIGKYY